MQGSEKMASSGHIDSQSGMKRCGTASHVHLIEIHSGTKANSRRAPFQGFLRFFRLDGVLCLFRLRDLHAQ